MSDEISSDEQNRPGTSRRTLLKGAAVGAGALWVAPVIDSFTAPGGGQSSGLHIAAPRAARGRRRRPCRLDLDGSIDAATGRSRPS